MAVGPFDERRPRLHDVGGNDRRPQHVEVFREEDAGQEVEVTPDEIADRTQLPGLIVARRAPTLDLVGAALGIDGVDVGLGVARQLPVEGFGITVTVSLNA